MLTRHAHQDPLDPAQLHFRRLEVLDFPLMQRWLTTDAVGEWWGKREWTIEDVSADYTPSIEGKEPVWGYIIMYGAAPIGYIQTYRLTSYPVYREVVDVDEGMAGVDLFIGETEYLHRGLGAPLIRKFVAEIVFGALGATSCFIDPDPRNLAAIRAYEKAGFHYMMTTQIPGEAAPAYLMRLDRTS